VQATQAGEAFLPGPYRFTALHFYRIHRTIPSAQPAPHAAILHTKMVRSSLFVIILIINSAGECGKFLLHKITAVPRLHLADDIVNLRFCRLVDSSHMCFIRQIENRRPRIRHPDAESGIQGKSFAGHICIDHRPAASARRAICRCKINIRLTLRQKLRLLQEIAHNSRHLEKIRRRYNTDSRLSLHRKTKPPALHAVGNRNHFLIRAGRQS